MKKKLMGLGLATMMVCSAGTSVFAEAPAAPVKQTTPQLTPEQQIKNITDYALKLKGVPFKVGGTTIKGFDASGYVQHVFGKHGVKLPRNSAEIYKNGVPVAKDKLKKGDLVFYNTTGKKGNTVSFVAIYLDKTQMIGVSTKSGVTIIDMNNNYWKTKFVGAKRIVK
ncbi:C40 family peptidase [Bacillus sp. FJAT-27231]|uniref:C40 family peptidase n=1 Tax=Bacillus sp. FJAT-27231 TaxID=1679168 RepID=UPI00069D3882|nr:C40 family peptidase [Bacillus sp. FJAT-27231]